MSKTIFITGANRGIGLELTKKALIRGDNVIASTRQMSSSPELLSLSKHYDKVKVVVLDVCNEKKLKELAKTIKNPIDILVCNAGVLNSYGGLQDPRQNFSSIETVLMTNIAGVFLTAQSFLSNILKGTPGKIAIISSRMGSQEMSGSNAPIYRASKAAATNLARSLAKELAPVGVAVGAYHPGWVRTDMGGAKADVSPSESALGLLDRFDALTLTSTGTFEDYHGNKLPF